MLYGMIEEYVGLPASELAKMTVEQERRYLRDCHIATPKKPIRSRVADNGIHVRGSVLGALGRTVTSDGPIKCYLDDNRS